MCLCWISLCSNVDSSPALDVSISTSRAREVGRTTVFQLRILFFAAECIFGHGGRSPAARFLRGSCSVLRPGGFFLVFFVDHDQLFALVDFSSDSSIPSGATRDPFSWAPVR
jgi:hypothetical protein